MKLTSTEVIVISAILGLLFQYAVFSQKAIRDLVFGKDVVIPAEKWKVPVFGFLIPTAIFYVLLMYGFPIIGRSLGGDSDPGTDYN